MAHPEIEEWLRTVDGVPLDPDGRYGNQCVDYVDAYAEAIFGVPWEVCVGGVLGANQLLDAAPDKYWIRIDNDPANPNLLPPRGAIVVTSGDSLNQWGHTYGVLASDVNGCDAMQQDGFAAPHQFVDGNWYSAKPAHKARMPWAAAGIGTTLGWLIPREEMIKDTGADDRGYGPAVVKLAAHQRTSLKTAKIGYRKAPSTKGELLRWLEPDKVYDFKGYVRREAVDGNDIWFVGAYSDGFAWSGGFTDPSTTGLKDLTATLFPAPAKASNVRTVGADGVNRRKGADKNAELIDSFAAGADITVGGYVEGTDPYGKGNKVWFVGGLSGGYLHSSAFTTQSIEGLKKLALPTAPVTPSVPVVTPKAYDFVADLDWVEKIPADIGNVELGRAPAKSAPSVIHQFGTLGRDTLTSLIHEFKRVGAFKSIHFAVSGKRCVQMVSLKDRAYHAGATGNDYVGIETDPAQDPETIATTRKLLAALKAMGYSTVYLRHREVPGNATECGSLIDLTKYELGEGVVPPTPQTPVEKPTVPGAPDPDQVQQFLDWIKGSWDASKARK